MALNLCIPDLIAAGSIPGRMAARAQSIYDELVQQYEARWGRAEAESRATAETVRVLDQDTLNRQRQTLLQAKAQQRIHYQATRKFDGGAEDGAVLNGRAMLAHLVRDERAQGISNVEFRWRNIKQSALGRMYDLLDKHRADLRGEVRNKSDLDDVVRELLGEATDSVNARELADSWRGTAEWLRQRFNAAGGAIGKMDHWGLPQSHDASLVGQMTAQQWIDSIAPMLDRARMVDDMTGHPMSDAKLTHMLRDSYEAIVSEGWSRRKAGSAGARSVGNRHAEQRILHFRSADDWLAYQARFGAGTPFDAMMGHVEMMARDIATMEILGPNPAATIRWMQDNVVKDAAERGTARDRQRAKAWSHKIDRTWGEVTGANRRVVSRRLALLGSTIRNYQTSTRLGSALLASMSDHATRAMVRHYNGLPATKAIGQYARLINPADSGDRRFARRSGIIGDEFTGRMAAHGRLHMEEAFGGRLAGGEGMMGESLVKANEISRRLADGVLRVSGLNGHTLAGREAMGMEFLSAARTYADRDYATLDAPWRNFLSRNGIGAGDWDVVRSTNPAEHRGVDWLDIDALPTPLRDRFFEGMLTEIEYAVPTGGLYERAIFNALPPGTVLGELMRVGLQFKMFPVTVLALHGQRIIGMTEIGKRATYATSFLASTTVMGAMAYQMGEMAKGKDPRPMTDRDFWWRAAMKGGGLGIFGDAIEFSRNEYGQDLGDIMAGPAFSSGQTLATAVQAGYASATARTAQESAAAGTLRGRAARGLMREVPGSSIWFIRSAYERLLVDTVANWANPNYADQVRTMERRAADEGTAYFAPPSAEGPQAWRAPDLANAFGPADE